MSPPAVNASPAPREHHEANGSVAVELLEDGAQLVARVHGDPVELPGYVERDRRDAAIGVSLDPEAVVLAHDSSRSMRRRIFPDGLFGSSETKRYSRGRLKRANVSDARQKASRPSSVTPSSVTT